MHNGLAMASASAELNFVLDAVIVVLVFVLLYLIYKKMLEPSFAQHSRRQPPLVQAGAALSLMEERDRLRQQAAALRKNFEAKIISREEYKRQAQVLLEHADFVEKKLAAF